MKKIAILIMLISITACNVSDLRKFDEALGQHQGVETYYPDQLIDNNLDDDGDLKMLYGVKDGDGYFAIKNYSDDTTYEVHIYFDDDHSRTLYIKPQQQTEAERHAPQVQIEKWQVETYTTPEKLYQTHANGIQLGSRKYEGDYQFRFHNTNDRLVTLNYYQGDSDSPQVKTVRIGANNSSGWQQDTGGRVHSYLSE
jgi:hypothetical protein